MIWLFLVVLLACSGIVSGSETALFGLERSVIRAFDSDHRQRFRRVARLMRQPSRVLMTVLITNTALNVAIFATSFTAARALDASGSIAALAGIAVLLGVLVFGEIVPKTVAMTAPAQYAPWAAAIIATLAFLLAPIRAILRNLLVNPLVRLLTPPASLDTGPVTTEELRALVEESAREGVIDSSEHEMLQAIVGAAKVSVREMMTPRVDMPAVRMDAPRPVVRKAARGSRSKRVIVYGTDLDDVRGIVSARDLFLYPRMPILSLCQEAAYVPEQVNVVQLLRFFRDSKSHLAVVVDEFGGTAGMVTVSEVVEWLAGATFDTPEKAGNAEAQAVDDNTYRLPGRLSARAWADRFGVRAIDGRMATVGGLVLAKLGRMPHIGDCVYFSNLRLTITSIRNRRIESILLERDAQPGHAKGVDQ